MSVRLKQEIQIFMMKNPSAKSKLMILAFILFIAFVADPRIIY